MNDVYQEAIISSIHEGNCYVYNSGGDPNEIYHLSYQELKDFHKKYYHPSNSTIYNYGNYDVFKLTEYLDREYMQKFSRGER